MTIGKFLRNVIYADILFSTSGGLLMAVGAPFLTQLLGLPPSLLVGAGLILIPWVVALAVIVRRQQVPAMAIVGVAAINALWGCFSFALLASDRIDPSALGTVFIVAQATTVIVLAVLQLIGLRRSAIEVLLANPGIAPR